jgi:hypothetical protein
MRLALSTFTAFIRVNFPFLAAHGNGVISFSARKASVCASPEAVYRDLYSNRTAVQIQLRAVLQ